MLLLKALSLSLFSRRALARRAESPSRCGAERLIARLRARRIASRSSVLSIACHSARAASSSAPSRQPAMRRGGRLGKTCIRPRSGSPGMMGTAFRHVPLQRRENSRGGGGPETWSPLPACGACCGPPLHPFRPSPDCLVSEPSERRARARCSHCVERASSRLP